VDKSIMSHTPSNLWPQISKHIRERVSVDGFERWFSNVTIAAVDGPTLRLGVPNPIHQFFIESNYLPIVRESVLLVAPTIEKVEFQTSEAESQPVPVAPTRKTNR
jgi:chromosomal replication initiation ATPase DnaA